MALWEIHGTEYIIFGTHELGNYMPGLCRYDVLKRSSHPVKCCLYGDESIGNMLNVLDIRLDRVIFTGKVLEAYEC